jgi:hypothetical protein
MHKFFLAMMMFCTVSLAVNLDPKKTAPSASLTTSSEKLKRTLGFSVEKQDKNLAQRIHEDTQKNIQKLKRIDSGDTKKPGQPGYFPSDLPFSKF